MQDQAERGDQDQREDPVKKKDQPGKARAVAKDENDQRDNDMRERNNIDNLTKFDHTGAPVTWIQASEHKYDQDEDDDEQK